MSLFWGFCPNLLNSAQIPRLLHCCHVLSDELSVNVWWVGYTLMHWQSLRERPGLCSQWCQVFHCGTVTVTGNYLATCHFPSDLLTFIVGGDRKVGALRMTEKRLPVAIMTLVTAPCPDPVLTAHCDIEYSEILPRPPAKHQHAHCHPLEAQRGHRSDIYK